MQAAKSRTAMLAKRIPACAQPLERFGDNDLAVTKLTTARIRKAEHASRRSRTRKPVRAFPHDLRACHDYIVTPARGLTAALLFLPLATTACPIGWTPSPTSATWGSRCFLVPPERSASLFRCVDLCEEHGGAPACIGSAEENAFVTAELAEAEGLWLGLYQKETWVGPAKGWDRCVGGDAPSFTNWAAGEPSDFGGYKENCAFLSSNPHPNLLNRAGSGNGKWYSIPCDSSLYAVSSPCLCTQGNASAAFADDRKALEATSGYNRWLLSRRMAISFSIAAALTVLPTLLLLGRAGWRRLRRGAGAEPDAGGQGAAASPSLPATAAALSTPSGAATSSAAVNRKLRAARASAAGRRLRVSFAMAQAGWALFVIGATPAIMFMTGQSPAAAAFDIGWWLVLAVPGGYLLPL